MSLQLTDAKKKAIVAFVKAHHEQHLARFPFARYPTEPLQAWKRAFADQAAVNPHTLRAALAWSCGKWQQQDVPYPYKKLHLAAVKNWASFTEQSLSDLDSIIAYWSNLLGDNEYAFTTTSFLVYLLCSDQIELTDSGRLRGIKDLLQDVEYDTDSIASAADSITLYTEFYQQLLPKVQPLFGDQAALKLDRFLFAYGHRETLEKVAQTKESNVEPTITALDWETVSSKHYNLHLITERANADILFASLLLTLEQKTERPEKLRIQDIMNEIPLGSGGICNSGSYNYALIAMFGKQKNRDYFQFDSPTIADSFTQQANQSTRDMGFYKRHADLEVTINAKYRAKVI